MTDVNKMRRYIERTGVKFPSAYHLSMGEVTALRDINIYDALCLAFEYGRAKGFRYSAKVNTDSRAQLHIL